MSTKILIHADKGVSKINRHIYGHFAEHLGRCIYGGLYVGEGNMRIPHTNGVRNDIIQALKDLSIPNLRWPGGCFADTYHWKDGIGPKPSRPGIMNQWWGNVTEDNSFGTHDFLNLCEVLNAEPYIAANVGSGTVQELADWVQYVNFEGRSPMSSLREQNGRAKPWKVKFWGIGNEAWGCGGNMTASYYANLYRQYVTFMSGWSNTAELFRIASGANSSDYAWTETLMKNIPHHLMEGLAVHHYAVADWNNRGPSTHFSDDQYLTNILAALRIDEVITNHAAIMDSYDPAKKIALIIDEWGAWYNPDPGTNPGFLHQQNTMRDAIIAGLTLNIFNKHCDRVRMANLAQTVNVLQAVILTEEEKMWFTPTYHVMHMYKVHQNATFLPLDFLSCSDLPTDGNTCSLSVSCSRNNEGVHITLVNMHPVEAEEVSIQLNGINPIQKMEGTLITSSKVDDHNTAEQPYNIRPQVLTDYQYKNGSIVMKLPRHSVALLSLKELRNS